MKAQDRENWLQAVIDHARKHGATRFNLVKATRCRIILQCFDKDEKKVFDRVLYQGRRKANDTDAARAFRLRREFAELEHWVHLLTEVLP